MSDPVTLNDVCSLIVDCEHKTAPSAAQGHEYGYSVGTPNIRNGRLLLSSAKRVDRQTFDAWSGRARPQKDDIILTREAPAGEAAFLDGTVPICLGQRTVLLRPDPERIVPRFLHYRLLGPAVQERIQARAGGSTVSHLNVHDVRRLVLDDVPSRYEQNAIATLLGALDDKIAHNERIEATHETILRARFDALEMDVDSEVGRSTRASELIEFNPVLPPPPPAGAVYLDMSALPTGAARVQRWSWRKPKSGTRFVNGCTVMARITPCLENGKTAFIDFMQEGEVGVGSTEFIVMRARDGIPAHLPYFLARSQRFRTHAIRNMVGSSGRQRVNYTQLVDFPLAQPDDNKLYAFDQAARTAFDHMRSIGAESRVLAQLRDTLLPKLMSGEIRVRDAEKVVEEAT